MSTAQSNEGQRPQSPPPDNRPKEELDVVFATSPDGRIFEIPTSVADKHEMTQDRARELGEVPILPYSLLTRREGAESQEAEVGGRHRVLLVDGTYGYHSDWLYGPYIWISNGRSYRGWHWHPNRYSALAYDVDN